MTSCFPEFLIRVMPLKVRPLFIVFEDFLMTKFVTPMDKKALNKVRFYSREKSIKISSKNIKNKKSIISMKYENI